MASEQDILNNFVGKPFMYNFDNGKDKFDLAFQQLKVEDLIDFTSIVSDWINNDCKFVKEDDADFGKNITKKCLPFIRKMLDVSFPNWKPETKEMFIANNVMVLRDILFIANTMTLINPILNQKKDVEFDQLINEKREQIDKCATDTSTETKAV